MILINLERCKWGKSAKQHLNHTEKVQKCKYYTILHFRIAHHPLRLLHHIWETTTY